MMKRMLLIFAAIFMVQAAFSATYTNSKGHTLVSAAAPVRVIGVSLTHHNGEYTHQQQVRLLFSYTNASTNAVHGLLICCLIKDPFGDALFETTFKEQLVIPGLALVKPDSYWYWDGYKDPYKKMWRVAANGTAKIWADVRQIVYADGSMWYSEVQALSLLSEETNEQKILPLLSFITNYNQRIKGKTILGMAVKNGFIHVLRSLKGKSVDWDMRSDMGYFWKDTTALQYAVYNDNLTIARILLSLGADPNAQGKIGNTMEAPLHQAVRKKNADLVKLLLQYGSNIHIKNKYGSTPYQQAVKAKNWSMVRLLRRWRQLRLKQK